MDYQSSDIVEIHIHYNPRSLRLTSILAVNSMGEVLSSVPDTLHEYETDPTNVNIQKMLTAYQRTPQSTAAKVFYKTVDIHGIITFFETAAAFTADTADHPTYRKPLQWMIDGNYFLRTNNPTNTEFSDVSAGGGQNTGGQPTITSYPVYLRRNYQNPPTVGPNATYVGASTDSIVVDGWDTTTLNGWATPSQTPASAGSGDMLFIAMATVELQPDNSYSRSPWVISPSIDGLSHQYSYDGQTFWQGTQQPNFKWQRIRTGTGDWSAPFLINPLDDIAELIAGTPRLVVDSILVNGDRLTVSPSFNLASINDFRFRCAFYETEARKTAEQFIEIATPWTPASRLRVVNSSGNSSSTLHPFRTSLALVAGPYGSRIAINEPIAAPSTSNRSDLHFNFTFMGNASTQEVHFVDLPRYSNNLRHIFTLETR